MMTDYAFLDFTILKLYIQKFTSVNESEQRKKNLQKKVIGYNMGASIKYVTTLEGEGVI